MNTQTRLGAQVMIPTSALPVGVGQVEGTVVDVKGKFIGFSLEGESSTFYWTTETIESWKAHTPDRPIKTAACPPAPKKNLDMLTPPPLAAIECPPPPVKQYKPRRLVF